MVRRLLPYLSPNPIIYDVGSNKGEWADIVISIAHELHLFEPNEIFLNYTQVKYCAARNVYYSSYAAWKESNTERDFHYFVNENNGLSSLYFNERWEDLPMIHGACQTVRLDDYAIGTIDLIKIDVEGAEFDVILGCEKLLKEKRVKFIQFEYSEHYKVSGHTIGKISHFVEKFGYRIFNDNLLPEYEENYTLSNYIIAPVDFTEDWNAEFKELTKDMSFAFALEIGCFEGLTTNYICDELLYPDGRIICVDPLEDEYLTENLTEEDRAMNADLTNFKGQYDRFIRNTTGKNVELIRKTSAASYPELQGLMFDFIFIDGDHREKQVYWDCKSCFPLLKVGGTMIMDDYEWSEGTKNGIDQFLREGRPVDDTRLVHLIHGNYVVVTKETNGVHEDESDDSGDV